MAVAEMEIEATSGVTAEVLTVDQGAEAEAIIPSPEKCLTQNAPIVGMIPKFPLSPPRADQYIVKIVSKAIKSHGIKQSKSIFSFFTLIRLF